MESVNVFDPMVISVGSVVVLGSLVGPVVEFDLVVIPGDELSYTRYSGWTTCKKGNVVIP